MSKEAKRKISEFNRRIKNPSESDKQNALIAGSGSAGAAAVSIQASGQEIKNLDPSKPIIVLHTDRGRGAGHYSQGKAVFDELRKQGIPAKLMNLDDFVPEDKKLAFNKVFGKMLDGSLPQAPYALKALNYYTNEVDWKSFRKATEGAQIVNMHAGMDMFIQRHIKTPMFTVHTDQAPFIFPNYNAQNRMGTFTQHLAADSAVPYLKKERPILKGRIHGIRGLPISPPNATPKKKLDPKKYNITVSGGGLGLGVDEQVETLLKSNLPNNTKIHVVTGYSGTPGKAAYDPGKIAKLNALKAQAAKRGVDIEVIGFEPNLRDMINQADLNVLRPGGTSIAEARASGKPFRLFLNTGVTPTSLSGRNVTAVNDFYKGSLGGDIFTRVGDTTSLNQLFSDISGQSKVFEKLKVGPTGGAPDIVKLVRTMRQAKNTPGGVSAGQRIGKGLLGAASVVSAAEYLRRRRGNSSKNSGGHWRKLPFGKSGKDAMGNKLIGKTWVKKQ